MGATEFEKPLDHDLDVLNSNIPTYEDINVTLTANSYVSPFSAYAQGTYTGTKEVIGILPLCTDINRVVATYNKSSKVYYVYGSSAVSIQIRLILK